MELTLTPRQKKIAGKTVIFIVMAILAIVALAPFYWSILIAFRESEFIYTDRSWLPSHVTIEHFKNVFQNVDIGRYFINTVGLTVVNVATNLIFASMAAYGFEKLRFKGSNAIFKIMMLSMMLPGIATTVPTFLLLRSFPLVGGNNIHGTGRNGLYLAPISACSCPERWACTVSSSCGSFSFPSAVNTRRRLDWTERGN